MMSFDTTWLPITGLIYFGLAIWLAHEYLRRAPEGRSWRRVVTTVGSVGAVVYGVLFDTICEKAITDEASHMVAIAMVVTAIPVLFATMTSQD